MCAAALAACQPEQLVAPFGLHLRERSAGGSVAAAIRKDAMEQPACPSAAPAASADWTVRTLAKPAGRLSLPAQMQGISAPGSEVTFYAPDMSAGAFVFEALNLASLEPPKDSPLPHTAIVSCRIESGEVESLVYLVSQVHPMRPGDSAHLAFLQIATPGGLAVRAGAFALTRALRDSLIGALLGFQPEP